MLEEQSSATNVTQLQRVPGVLRSNDPAFLNATDYYMQSVCEIIAEAQITNGGPVILFQPENEYYDCLPSVKPCPNHKYMKYVEDQARNAGIVVPFIVNDNNDGNFAPNSGQLAAVDIYGIDSYPLGFDCANPYVWPDGDLQTDLTSTHLEWSPLTPFSFVEVLTRSLSLLSNSADLSMKVPRWLVRSVGWLGLRAMPRASRLPVRKSFLRQQLRFGHHHLQYLYDLRRQ